MKMDPLAETDKLDRHSVLLMKQRASKNTRRARGRPRRISRDTIVRAALAMLQKHEFSALTMSKLGKRVGASTMALYTYFPSRNALLDAVADHIFSQLVLPPESATWEVATVEWINALYSHFERFPVACR